MKRVKINYEWWDAIVDIDPTPETAAKMKEQLLFWMGGQEMIDDADGDVEKAYLIMLAKRILPLSMHLNAFGIRAEIADEEGWCPIDGTEGVNLISVDSWEFSESDIDISIQGGQP